MPRKLQHKKSVLTRSKKSSSRPSKKGKVGKVLSRARKKASKNKKPSVIVKAVSSVVSKASTLSKRVRKKAAISRRSSKTKAAALSKKQATPFTPVKRKSVIKKPARLPTIITKKKKVAKSIKKSITRKSGVDWLPIKPDVSPKRRSSSSQSFIAKKTEESLSMPKGYSDNRVVLMVKDPWWLYAYWDIDEQTERAVRSQLSPKENIGLRSVIRIIDDAEEEKKSVDIEVSDLVASRYINTNAPGRSFFVELGFLTKSGRFMLLGRSNRATSPSYGPSDVVDEKWKVSEEDFSRLMNITAGIGSDAGVHTIKELFEDVSSSVGFSSAGYFSQSALEFSKKSKKEQKLPLWVDAELILYGRTHPKASVTVADQPVSLRPDGTFSLRVVLPEGAHPFALTATSADGQEKKAVETILMRKTQQQNSRSSQARRKKSQSHH